MKIRYLAVIFLFLFCISMLNVVDAKTININEDHSSKEIKKFFNNGGKIAGKTLSKGDIIIFHKGHYGNLNLNTKKSVHIRAKGKVYFGSVTLKSNNVKMKGFNFNYLALKGNKNRITSSNIHIMKVSGSKNTINKNKIYNYGREGIRVSGSENKFVKNTISDYDDGMILLKGTKNLIYKNTFKNLKFNGIISFSGTSNTKITKNKFSNIMCGVYYYPGSVTISGNKFYKITHLKTTKLFAKGTYYGY